MPDEMLYIDNTGALNTSLLGTGLSIAAGVLTLGLATVAFSGAYADLTGTPTIPAAQIQSDWTQASSGALDFIKNKPSIPSAQVQSDWNASSGVSSIQNKPTLFNGAFSSLTGKPTTLAGYGITDAYPLSGNPSSFLTGITSGQVTTALGFTPYNSTNPSGFITSSALSGYATTSAVASGYQPLDGDLTALAALTGTNTLYYRSAANTWTAVTIGSNLTFSGGTLSAASPGTGTVTSMGISSTTLTVAGSPVTASGSITVNLVAPSVNNAPGRSIVTVAAAANGFQISSTRNCMASYSVTITANASGLLAGASSGYVLFEICATNSVTASDWIAIGRFTNGQSFTSILTLSSTQPIGSDIMKFVPATWYTRLRSVNVLGTPSFAITESQETLI